MAKKQVEQDPELVMDLDELLAETESPSTPAEVADLVANAEDDADDVEEAEGVYNTKTASAYAGVSVHYMRNLLANGTIASYKNESGRWRTTKDDLDKWMASRPARDEGDFELLEQSGGKQASLKEAAELAGLSVGYTRQLVVKGRIAGNKDESGRWIVDAESARNFEKQRETGEGILYIVQLTDEQVTQLQGLGYEPVRKNRGSITNGQEEAEATEATATESA